MHVCFIEDTHLHGGTQIWVTEANRAFLARGAQVTILAPEGSWVIDQCSNTGARLVTYDWDAVVAQDDFNQEIWTSALADCDVAVCTVHPPRQDFHCAVFAAICIRAGDLKTHLIPKTGTIVPEYLREFYLPDENIRSSVIAIADFTRRYLIDHYRIPEDGVKLIYQGVDVDRFISSQENKETARQIYEIPSDSAPVLGSIGSLEHRKGHPVLFQAVAKLVAGPLAHVHLMIVGDGPDEEMLKEQVHSMGLDDHITFFPFTDKPNLVFERIDITVLSSLYKEGLPNVLLESMAMGVPVVSTELGGVAEIVLDGQTGYKVDIDDSDALAHAIERLWADQSEYKRMGNNAHNLISEKFDKRLQFDRFLEHFEQIKAQIE